MEKLRFFGLLLCTFLLVCFVMNKSIIAYLEQRYHLKIDLESEILDEANTFKMKLEQIHAVFSGEKKNKFKAEANLNETNATFIVAEANTSEENNQSLEMTLQETFDANSSEQNQSIALPIKVRENDEFLLIGDSLMQGVALALSKDLKDLGIKNTNLSKQNTGLSFKKYFDWIKTTEQALKEKPNIKFLVVLLGANDPWDIKIDKKYERFGSFVWSKYYALQIQNLLEVAKKRKVQVFWYEIPPVKRKSLNEKIQLLNSLYKEQSQNFDAVFIETKADMSLDNEYSTYIKGQDGKSIKVRADDGIHFSISGARIMSKLLLDKIEQIP